MENENTESTVIDPPWGGKKKSSGLSHEIRTLDVGKDITFPAGNYKFSTIRSMAHRIASDYRRKFRTHVYEDGSIGVWRER